MSVFKTCQQIAGVQEVLKSTEKAKSTRKYWPDHGNELGCPCLPDPANTEQNVFRDCPDPMTIVHLGM